MHEHVSLDLVSRSREVRTCSRVGDTVRFGAVSSVEAVSERLPCLTKIGHTNTGCFPDVDREVCL